MNNEAVMRELCDVHGCHTVVLYGSRARGDHREDSDFDVLGIRADGESVRDARLWQGGFLDAFVYPEAALEVLDPEMDRLAGGIVLCERDGQGTALLARAEALAAEPAKPLKADDRQLRTSWARKMASRIRPLGPEDLEANYRRAWLLHQLLEDYFALRTLPFKGSKLAFQWLAVNEPELYRAYQAALEPGAELAAIDRLVELATRGQT
ncbi:MAG: hypothetical protein JWM80_4783 [Cyanobacteria bacterium RYN_339]|nr:hypothetical protein [Cyanobacteria bacterium RYN_339]